MKNVKQCMQRSVYENINLKESKMEIIMLMFSIAMIKKNEENELILKDIKKRAENIVLRSTCVRA